MSEYDEGIRLAKEDLSALYLSVSALVQGQWDGSRTILVDGSKYSPSWRAMPGGEKAWETYYNLPYRRHEDERDIWDGYQETLDNGLDSDHWGGGIYLYWEDGMLFAAYETEDEDE
jgi:hypothetical protein